MAAPTGPNSIPKRDHASEKHLAVSRRAARFAGIREKRDDGVLSEEIFQVSQALILCGLPYQPTTERHFGMLMWGAIPVLNLMAIVWPSAQSIMSQEVGPEQQGQLQGAVNSLRGIAGMLGPGLFTYIFSKTLGIAPGAAFFTAAGILLVSLAISEVVRPEKQGVGARV